MNSKVIKLEIQLHNDNDDDDESDDDNNNIHNNIHNNNVSWARLTESQSRNSADQQ